MRHERQANPGWQAATAAGALLDALRRADEMALARALNAVQLLAESRPADTWTEERLDLLTAVATTVKAGQHHTAGEKMLAHLAGQLPASAFLM